MENLKKYFPKYKVLALYICGSVLFGTEEENSDLDYVVILDGFSGMHHIKEGKKEYFIFSKDAWIDKMKFSSDLPEYYKVFNDEILNIQKSLIYLDASFEDEFNSCVNRDFKTLYKQWLKEIVSYYEFYLLSGAMFKNMYHLIRVSYILKRFKETGSFSLALSAEVLTRIKEYKQSTNFEPFKSEILSCFNFIKEIAEDS